MQRMVEGVTIPYSLANFGKMSVWHKFTISVRFQKSKEEKQTWTSPPPCMKNILLTLDMVCIEDT